MENPSAFIENALHQHLVGLFTLVFSSPNPHIKPHASQRPLEETHVDRLYKSFKTGIKRLSAPPILAILGSPIQPSMITDSSSPSIFPEGVDLFIFSGQHRVKALEKLAQDDDDRDNAWWVVKVYNEELERTLPFVFEVLVVKENEQAPEITRGVCTIDLFRMCQKLAKEPGHATLRALRGANSNPKKAKPSSTSDDTSLAMEGSENQSSVASDFKPSDTVPYFALAFLNCLEYPIVFGELEKVMEIPVFHTFFNLYGFRVSVFPRMSYLCRAVLNEVHQFWTRLLADERNLDIITSKLEAQSSGKGLAGKKTLATLKKQWKVDTSKIEQGPKGPEYLVRGPSAQPDWVFGDTVPFPSWVSGNTLKSMIQSAAKMADMAKSAIKWNPYNADSDFKQREDFLEAMGENREKFEFDCYRYSDLSNSDLEKVKGDPRFRQFIECCPLSEAKDWLQMNRAVTVDSFERQDIGDIPYFVAQGAFAEDLDEILSSSGANRMDPSTNTRVVGATTSTNGPPDLQKGIGIAPIRANRQICQKTKSTEPVTSRFSQERYGMRIERGTPGTRVTGSTHEAGLKSIQRRGHHEDSQSRFSLDSDSQSEVPRTEWKRILDVVSNYDSAIQSTVFNLFHRMMGLNPTDLDELIELVDRDILHRSGMDMIGPNKGERPKVDHELDSAFSISGLSGMEKKRKRDQQEEDPILSTTLTPHFAVFPSVPRAISLKDDNLLDWDQCRADFRNGAPITFILGAGASVAAGLEVYRKDGRVLPKFKEMLSYPQWNKQGALRTALWNWVKHLRNVSDNDESPPYVHRLINRCYQAGRLKHVITFNIDGLEFKEGRLHERKIHSTSTGPFLQQMEVRNGFPSVLQMHGDISHGRCRICRHIQPLTINQIDELSLGGLVYCDFCKQKDKNTPIHPNITLYDDPFDTGIPVEHQEVFHEAIGICGKRPPGIVIVIGLSLSKARVLPWLTAASKQRKFIIVNTKYETAFKKFDPSSQVIVSDAQEWASEMMKSFSIINPTDKCGSSNRKRSKVSND